jgi:copper(I)-binding protein
MKRLVPILVALLALASCNAEPLPATPASPFVRLAAVPGRPASGYFQLPAEAHDNVLLSVTSPQARRIEMHESMATGSMSSMRSLDRVPVRAGEQLTFAPSGRHLMLYDVDPAIHPGGEIALVLHYGQGPERTLSARVEAAGGPG